MHHEAAKTDRERVTSNTLNEEAIPDSRRGEGMPLPVSDQRRPEVVAILLSSHNYKRQA